MSENLEKCDCGKVAVWMYGPSSNRENPFYCDDCVPRGCSCNHQYVNKNSYSPPLDKDNSPTKEDDPIKWIKEGEIWCSVDEQGREYPCCEYWYDGDGFEKD